MTKRPGDIALAVPTVSLDWGASHVADLPADTYETRFRPEQKLLIAILERAWRDLDRNRPGRFANSDPDFVQANNRAAFEATHWLLSRSRAEWSFHWVCEQLGVPESSANRLRALARLKQRLHKCEGTA